MKTKSFVRMEFNQKETEEFNNLLKSLSQKIRSENKSIENNNHLLVIRYRPMKIFGMIKVSESSIEESSKKIKKLEDTKDVVTRMIKQKPLMIEDLNKFAAAVSDYEIVGTDEEKIRNIREIRYRVGDIARGLNDSSISIN